MVVLHAGVDGGPAPTHTDAGVVHMAHCVVADGHLAHIAAADAHCAPVFTCGVFYCVVADGEAAAEGRQFHVWAVRLAGTLGKGACKDGCAADMREGVAVDGAVADADSEVEGGACKVAEGASDKTTISEGVPMKRVWDPRSSV